MPLLLVPPLLLVLVRRREAAKPGELQQQAASIMARVVIRRMSQAQRPRAWLLSTRRDGAASDRRLLRVRKPIEQILGDLGSLLETTR